MSRAVLRLFPQFRALEADRDTQVLALREEVGRLTTENDRLHDRIESVLEDRRRMWDLMEKSIEEMKVSYQSHVNLQWQKQGFGAPYPDAPHLPQHAEPNVKQEPVPRREFPSEAQARAVRKAYADIVERLKPSVTHD